MTQPNDYPGMLEHARAIAAALGGNWHVEEYRPYPECTDPNDLAEWDRFGAYLVETSSGFKVTLYRPRLSSVPQMSGKVQACIWTPRMSKSHRCGRKFRDVSPSYRSRTAYDSLDPAIAFSMHKKPSVQGREIVRRLVEPHRADFESMVGFLHDEKVRDQEAADLVTRLQNAGIKLEKPRNGHSESHLGWIGPLDIAVTPYGSIEVKGTCNNFTEEQALAVKELFDARGWTKRGFEQ
jgi:hypothetical protein